MASILAVFRDLTSGSSHMYRKWTSPTAAELAGLFIGFGELGANLDEQVLLDEYLRLRPDGTLRERMEAFSPVIRFGHMAWTVRDAFEGLTRSKHSELNSRCDPLADVSVAMKLISECVRHGVLGEKADGLTAEEVFGTLMNP